MIQNSTNALGRRPMYRSRQKSPVFSFLLLLVAPIARAGPAYEILSHTMDVVIHPAESRLRVVDKVQVRVAKKVERIQFVLSHALHVTNLFYEGREVPYSQMSHEGGPRHIEIDIGPGNERTVNLVWEYSGKIKAPIESERSLSFVRGEASLGRISDKGIYLAPQTHWYPDRKGSFSIFRLSVSVPEPFRVVTQGDLVERNSEGGRSNSVWNAKTRADGLVLVGNKFKVNTERAGRVEVSSYFLEEDQAQAGLFLNAAKNYLATYSKLFGRYPYSRFDIVQNFFSTGHGLPGFTLLGPYVIKRGQASLKPGYLDHEIVHCWWGNFVFVDENGGNWCEALTTYWTNYYQKELAGVPESAPQHRRLMLQKYAIRVPRDKDYPLRQFITKQNESDGEIGYSKGAMVFHEVRRMIGDEAFRRSMRSMVRKFGGRRASWDDFKKVFEDESGKSFTRFFQAALDQPGAPTLLISNAEVEVTHDGYRVTGALKQTGRRRVLEVPLVLIGAGHKKEKTVSLKGVSRSFEFKVGWFPLALEADGNYDLFRHLPEDEWTPCLNAALSQKPIVVVENLDGKNPYFQLASTIRRHTSREPKTVDQLSEEDLGGSVIYLGSAKSASEFLKAKGLSAPDGIEISEKGFKVGDKEFKDAGNALLATWRRADAPQHFVTCYSGQSAAAVSRWRYIFYYGWDSRLLFANGRPQARWSLHPPSARTRVSLAEVLGRELHPEQLVQWVRRLSNRSRFPGGREVYEVRAMLRSALVQAGLEPVTDGYLQSFRIKTADMKKSEEERRQRDKDYPHFLEPNVGSKTSIRASNLLGILKAGRPKAGSKVIVIGAHYDGLGQDDQGRIYPGADDNASGVAALLEIARALSAHRKSLHSSVLFALFDAEEWGLLGSRHFVENPPVSLSDVTAMLNLDSIGSGQKGKVYLIGSSIHKSLAESVRPFLSGLELTEGKNIDKFAFKKGSDHYPFHEKGVPVVNFFAGDYRKLNTPEDKADKVDSDHLSRVARLVYVSILKLATE